MAVMAVMAVMAEVVDREPGTRESTMDHETPPGTRSQAGTSTEGGTQLRLEVEEKSCPPVTIATE